MRVFWSVLGIIAVFLCQQLVMSQLSTHVLDTSRGKPAKQVNVSLFISIEHGWIHIHDGVTDEDGRYNFSNHVVVKPGRYKIHFEVEKYFTLLQQETIFPFAEVAFDVKEDTNKLHIPLLLSPYGYSTYRGS